MFKKWLLIEEKDIDYYKKLILSKLELDNQGLSQSLNIWKPESLINKLNELGEYKNLSLEKRKNVENIIKSKSGTINDLIKVMV